MDPVTQGVLGAAFAQTRGPQHTLAKAAVIGAIAGMAPDLDTLIRSATDPLLGRAGGVTSRWGQAFTFYLIGRVVKNQHKLQY